MQREVYLICNAHIDPMWLWEWEEGAAATLSTFRSAARLCEKYGTFVFNHNEALLYQWIEEYEPSLFEKIQKQYETNQIYKTIVDHLKEFIETRIDLEKIDYISGGERRDWYFSIILAYLLGKPHITIYKDLSTIVSTCDFEEATPVTKLSGKNVLHIADLITIASSYLRAWVPAIKNLDAHLTTSVSVVDRMQGGAQVLSNLGIRCLSLFQINQTLFQKAKDLGIINETQLQMLQKFSENPDDCMREFLVAHPEFLENALNSDDPKTAKRAKLCKDQNLYHL